jgi:hypothetical protein
MNADTLPSPSAIQASTVGTDHLVTPQTNPPEFSVPININPNNLLNPSLAQVKPAAIQAQTLRYLQAVAANKTQPSPSVLANLVQQAKNGNIDPNGATMQQIKSLIMIQQQQQLAKQAAMGSVGAGTGNVNLGGSIGTGDPIVQAAALQARQPVSGSVNTTSIQQQGLAPTVPPSARTQLAKIWQGNVTWQQPNGVLCMSALAHGEGQSSRGVTVTLAVDVAPSPIFVETDINTSGWGNGTFSLDFHPLDTNLLTLLQNSA